MKTNKQAGSSLTVLRAEYLGMCFGVRDAIELANQQVRQMPVTVLGELVHNQTVLQDLEARGVRFAATPADVQSKNVLITAHGTSNRTRSQLQRDGFHVLEATCPLVHFAHRALAQLVEQGFHPVIIGRRDHVEVRGLTGDLDDFDVVLDAGDVERLRARDRFGVVSQTTQPINRVRELVGMIRVRFPGAEVRFRDTVCQPTKQRQSAAIELARQCDVVIVIGGANSNNTRELVATCSCHCPRVHHVQSAADLQPAWFSDGEVVGITAGTSTPDTTIEAVEGWLKRFIPQDKTRNVHETMVEPLRA